MAIPDTTNTIASFQDAYDSAIYPALEESGVQTIPDMISRLETTSDAQKGIFYNIDPAATSEEMDGTDQTDPGTAGNIT